METGHQAFSYSATSQQQSPEGPWQKPYNKHKDRKPVSGEKCVYMSLGEISQRGLPRSHVVCIKTPAGLQNSPNTRQLLAKLENICLQSRSCNQQVSKSTTFTLKVSVPSFHGAFSVSLPLGEQMASSSYATEWSPSK